MPSGIPCRARSTREGHNRATDLEGSEAEMREDMLKAIPELQGSNMNLLSELEKASATKAELVGHAATSRMDNRSSIFA